MFPSVIAVAEYRDPLLTGFMRGDGKEGWFGWPNVPKVNEIFDTWLEAVDSSAQTRLERAYELEAFAALPFLPLGRLRQTSAWRDNVSGILEGPSVVFWNIDKT